MPPRPKPKKKNPYLVNGRLISPPRRTKADEEAEEQRRLKRKSRKEVKVPGLVKLEDLLSGEYWRRKEAERVKKEEIKARKRLKLEEDRKVAEEQSIK